MAIGENKVQESLREKLQGESMSLYKYNNRFVEESYLNRDLETIIGLV